jgi:acyl carrier protein
MKKIFLLISALALLQSCGGGVESRAISSDSNSTDQTSSLTPEQIQTLAKEKVQKDLELLGIKDSYADAKKIYPSSTFAVINDFISIKCADSKYADVVTKYKNYGALLAEVKNLIAELSENYLDDQQKKDLNLDSLMILLDALELSEEYEKIIAAHSLKCQSIKLINLGGDTPVEDEKQGPIGPPSDEK